MTSFSAGFAALFEPFFDFAGGAEAGDATGRFCDLGRGGIPGISIEEC